MTTVTRVLLISTIALTACGPSDSERMVAELSQLVAAQDRQMKEMEQNMEERLRRQAQEAERQRVEAERQRIAAARAEELARVQAVIDAVRSIEVSFRESIPMPGTYVMILTNPQAWSVDFDLKCFQRNGSSKRMFVSVPARGYAEVGFMQGWDGNYVRGERCEAWIGDNLAWNLTV